MERRFIPLVVVLFIVFGIIMYHVGNGHHGDHVQIKTQDTTITYSGVDMYSTEACTYIEVE